jgi:hypothetical protein
MCREEPFIVKSDLTFIAQLVKQIFRGPGKAAFLHHPYASNVPMHTFRVWISSRLMGSASGGILFPNANMMSDRRSE